MESSAAVVGALFSCHQSVKFESHLLGADSGHALRHPVGTSSSGEQQVAARRGSDGPNRTCAKHHLSPAINTDALLPATLRPV
jgi:hypothetical protein